MELGDAELTLLGGQSFHQRGDGVRLGRQQVVAVAGGRDKGVAGSLVELRDQFLAGSFVVEFGDVVELAGLGDEVRRREALQAERPRGGSAEW